MNIEQKEDGLWYTGGKSFSSREAAELFAESREPVASDAQVAGAGGPPPISFKKVLAAGTVAFLLYAMASSDSGPETYGDSHARAHCETYLTGMLKAPGSAEFSSGSDTKISGTSPGPFTVRGFVDAQNSFGAKLRRNYLCTVTFKEGKAHLSGGLL